MLPQQKCRSALHPETQASYCTWDSYGYPPNHNHQLQYYYHRFGSNRPSVSRLLCTQSGCLRTIQVALRLQVGWWRWRQSHDICRACDRCLVGRSCKKGLIKDWRERGGSLPIRNPTPSTNTSTSRTGGHSIRYVIRCNALPWSVVSHRKDDQIFSGYLVDVGSV